MHGISAFLIALCVLTVHGSDLTDPCASGCQHLVSGPHGVPDSAITTSTNPNYKLRARLSNTNGWFVPANVVGAWVQVAFSHMKEIFRIQTRGPTHTQQYTREYKLSTSQDCKYFQDYAENGQVKAFLGNYDATTLVTHALRYPVTALCLRITVLSRYQHPHLRFDVIGRTACGRGSTFWKDSCYSLIKEKSSWLDAEGYCKRRQGGLVIVDSDAEAKWLETFILDQVSHYTTVNGQDCPGTALGYVQGRTETDCLRHCLKTSQCTGFITNPSTKECWWKSTCAPGRLVSKPGRYVNILSTRSNDVWLSVNRLADGTVWEVKRDVAPRFYNWANKQPSKNRKQRCATMSPGLDYKWQTAACDTKAYFICESSY